MSESQASRPPAPQAQSRGGGGRRRGRGGARQLEQSGTPDSPGRGPRSRGSGPRRGGGGRGGRGGHPRGAGKAETVGEDTVAANGQRSSDTTVQSQKESVPEESVDDADDADDAEICFICASKVEHNSISPCNHRTCHICALRLRALYKNKACAHCRTEASYVVFTDDPAKRYEEFTDGDFSRKDDNLGIKYEKDEIFEDTVLLLRYNCPDRTCDVACLGWPDLHRHVKTKHGKVMCDLCTRNKKVFTHEHELFTVAELRKHERHGDDVPGALDQSGFKGHPECGFCRQRFYGDDELYAHCRDRHERCHICDRRSTNRQHQYYIDYNALEHHFGQEHFLCLDKECLEKKFVVFESQMDLKAHQLESHPNGLPGRDARAVDMTAFDYRTPYQPQRGRRGAGRGRDPNAETAPLSTVQPLRRDEIAYQRQMAIQSAQSVSTRSFGGQLSRDETQTVRAPPRSSGPTPTRTPPAPATPVNELEHLNITSATPEDQARRLRHTAVIERASNLLGNDETKLSEFRTRVSSYRTSHISATELIDAFFSLFDTSSSELGKLIKELAEIYEDNTKRNSLLKAWNDWRAINEDYPALPGPGGVIPGMSPGTVNTSGTGGRRVLRLKSSTAQSSRAAAGRSGSSSSASNPFPPLSSSSRPTPRPTATAAAWGGTAIAAPPPISRTYANPSFRSTPSKPSGPVNARDAEAFPSLPAAAKPNVLMAGLTRGTVRWDDRRPPPANAWASSADPGPGSAEEDFPDLSAGTGKKGKGKKGKQTLYHFG
ncbi:E3 ubiquitin-protein ligase HEL2 [Aspergillus lucknowensis]|uniref:RING-type E3 ubiquitin transferase n=1 Tax=Aspergillus lucknowensis TaxID=176173 RepID=A0ABR4LZF4_9EURO